MKTNTAKIAAASMIILLISVAAAGLLCNRCIAASDDTLSEGLVMHLSFDAINEISGQKIFMDESGHENHGTLLSGQIAEGKVGNALKCSAINRADCVRVKDNDSLDLDAVSIAAWIKTNQIDGQWGRILDKGWKSQYNLCTGGDFKGYTWYRNRVQIECAHRSTSSKTPVVDNEWHLIVGTYDGQTMQIYIDGKLDIERTLEKPDATNAERKDKSNIAAPMKHNDVDIMIGALAVPELSPHEHAFFDGLIDEVRIYSRILSDKEVQLLYQSSESKKK